MLPMLKPVTYLSNLLACLIAVVAFPNGFAQAQTCPQKATGSCFVPHLTPGCDDSVCCNLVCAFDSFCCETEWDYLCAEYARNNCEAPPPPPEECGSPSAGLCTVIHKTPACSDADCCETVCEFLPYCCLVAWDLSCVTAAFQACQSSCAAECPSNSMPENEPCDPNGSVNSPCIDGSPNTTLLTLQNSKTICGKFHFVSGGTDGLPDLDAYKIVLPDPDGDGFARVSIDIQAEYGTIDSGTVPVFVALLSQPCAPLSSAEFSIQTSGCFSNNHIECVSAGTWYVVVARGTFPNASEFTYGCPEVQNYNLKVSWDNVCSNQCGSPGDCFAKHSTPGCEIATCCNSVCAIDPICCLKAWDQICVDLAVSICNPPVPTNDECSQATQISLGEVPFTLIRATVGSGLVPADCITLSPEILASWSIEDQITGTPTGTSYNYGPADSGELVGGTMLSCVHTNLLTFYATEPGNGSDYALRTNYWSVGDYYQVKVNTLNYGSISISWDQARNSLGPATSDLVMSINGGSTWTPLLSNYSVLIATGNTAWNTVTYQPAFTRTVSVPVAASNQASVLFRMKSTVAALGNTGAYRIDNIVITGTRLTPIVGDVWFRLKNVRGQIAASTCGPEPFNTALLVYPYPCNVNSTAISCNDDNTNCAINQSSATVLFSAQCGSEYLIRIASVGGSIGAGTLNVTSTQPACITCLADYNNDGQRNGTDLAYLLSGWNTPVADVTGDGVTDGADLTLLLSGWGACP